MRERERERERLPISKEKALVFLRNRFSRNS